jgi:ABC-type Fe3+/spermidine/putrescine transport system ATPase subunit
VVVLDHGRVVQEASVAELYADPSTEAVAAATGDVNVVPVTIRGNVVESVIGAWDVAHPPFSGSGIALIRPDDFSVPPPGEDSDLIFGVEEASFQDGRWLATGMLSGSVMLRVSLPAGARVHKGKLLALRYDPARIRLIRREMQPLQPTIPTDVVPPLAESR